MIQMPPNFHLFANSSTDPQQTNADNTNNITNTSSISNQIYLINSEESLDDLLSLDYNMSDSNSYGQGFDDLADFNGQPLIQNYSQEYNQAAAAALIADIKNEPGFSEDTQSSFNLAGEQPRPITEKVVNKKNGKEQIFVKWGPIKVRPRQRPAPTLASGRKSKNTVLSPEEERKREERRKRNREAAEKCKQNRENVVKNLEKNYEDLVKEQNNLLIEHDNLFKEKTRLLQLFNAGQASNVNSVYNQEYGNTYQSYAFSNVSQYPPYNEYQLSQNQSYNYMNPQQSTNIAQSSQSTMQNYSLQMQPTSYNFNPNQQWNQ